MGVIVVQTILKSTKWSNFKHGISPHLSFLHSTAACLICRIIRRLQTSMLSWFYLIVCAAVQPVALRVWLPDVHWICISLTHIASLSLSVEHFEHSTLGGKALHQSVQFTFFIVGDTNNLVCKRDGGGMRTRRFQWGSRDALNCQQVPEVSSGPLQRCWSTEIHSHAAVCRKTFLRTELSSPNQLRQRRTHRTSQWIIKFQ